LSNQQHKSINIIVDRNKAFDRVGHDQLVEVLNQKNLDSRDIRSLGITSLSTLTLTKRLLVQGICPKTDGRRLKKKKELIRDYNQ